MGQPHRKARFNTASIFKAIPTTEIGRAREAGFLTTSVQQKLDPLNKKTSKLQQGKLRQLVILIGQLKTHRLNWAERFLLILGKTFYDKGDKVGTLLVRK